MVFISGNVPSSKNSKNAVPGKGVFHSKTVKSYLKEKGIQTYSVRTKYVKGYKTRPNIFLKEASQFVLPETRPLILGFHFVRSSRRRYDFHNAVQIIFDLLVAHAIIEDDDTTIIYGVPFKLEGRLETLDPKNPGVYLKFIDNYEH
jgi:hypothetical protein